MCNSLIYACVIKLTFPFTLYHVLKASGLLGVDCLFYTFHQGGIYTHAHTRLCVFIRVHPRVYVHTHMRVYINIGGSTSLCGRAVCIVSVCFTSLVTTFCLVFSFSNEVACAAPKTVIHFLSKVAILFA